MMHYFSTTAPLDIVLNQGWIQDSRRRGRQPSGKGGKEVVNIWSLPNVPKKKWIWEQFGPWGGEVCTCCAPWSASVNVRTDYGFLTRLLTGSRSEQTDNPNFESQTNSNAVIGFDFCPPPLEPSLPGTNSLHSFWTGEGSDNIKE